MNKEQIIKFFEDAIINGATRDVVFSEQSEVGRLEVELVAPPQFNMAVIHLSFPRDEKKEFDMSTNAKDVYVFPRRDLLKSRHIVRDAVGNLFHEDGSDLTEEDWQAMNALDPDCDWSGYAELAT